MPQAPPQGSLNAPLWPKLPILVSPIANHTVTIVAASEQSEFPMYIGQGFFAVVHNEQGITRPVVGLDDAAIGKVIPINRYIFRPMVKFRQMANAF